MFNLIEINRNTIVKEGSPLLREESNDVKFPLSQEIQTMIQKMELYLIESSIEKIAIEKNLEPAVGLAAIQIGQKYNIFSAYIGEEIITFINPQILKSSKNLLALEGGEGCLSIPKRREGYVYRSEKIKVQYFDKKGKKQQKELQGIDAIVFQHEYDHLKGTLYFDYINENDPFYIEKNSKLL